MKLANRFLLLAVLLPLIASCSTLRATDSPDSQISKDPLEGVNRSIYSFNRGVDTLIVKPVAKTYKRVLPEPAKKGVNRFFANLTEPLNALNNLLQGKFDRALSSAYRFTVNSTLGVFGLFDVAGSYDVKPAKEDFGQTLAAWGVGPGPYLMLPLAGPTNLRDGVGRVTDAFVFYPFDEITDSSRVLYGLVLLDLVALRVSLLGTDKVLDSQLDPYAFLKRAYEQNRLTDIYDGKPPVEDDFDF